MDLPELIHQIIGWLNKADRAELLRYADDLPITYFNQGSDFYLELRNQCVLELRNTAAGIFTKNTCTKLSLLQIKKILIEFTQYKAESVLKSCNKKSIETLPNLSPEVLYEDSQNMLGIWSKSTLLLAVPEFRGQIQPFKQHWRNKASQISVEQQLKSWQNIFDLLYKEAQGANWQSFSLTTDLAQNLTQQIAALEYIPESEMSKLITDDPNLLVEFVANQIKVCQIYSTQPELIQKLNEDQLDDYLWNALALLVEADWLAADLVRQKTKVMPLDAKSKSIIEFINSLWELDSLVSGQSKARLAQYQDAFSLEQKAEFRLLFQEVSENTSEAQVILHQFDFKNLIQEINLNQDLESKFQIWLRQERDDVRPYLSAVLDLLKLIYC